MKKQSWKLRKLNRILRQVKARAPWAEGLTDEQLAAQTDVFRGRLAGGETLDKLLPEAFAVACEADKRVLGKYPYDVQILGGIAMHRGYLVEMNTGEGKTLMATLPLYLNALTGKCCILVTANEYLAIRDAEEMSQVYRFLGLTSAAGVRAKGEEAFTNEEKQAIYASDIVYTTHGVLGFDYLLNNLVTKASDRFLRELYYVIIDEADSVLLDGAQVPLVISGSPRVQSNLYELADFFVTTLREGRDYETEEKKVWLTDRGVEYAEHFFRIPNFYGEEYFEINRHVTLALRAHVLFRNRKDYMISRDGELMLLDGGSGRLMPGVKLRGGQHQALEVKEGQKPSMEMRSVASITYQNLFRLFEKMAGMSGTVSDASDELREVYGEEVLIIPPNRPVQRRDLPDRYFTDAETQISAAIREAYSVHDTGQPVLIVVSTIAETELISSMLTRGQIPHNVLNANNAAWEAEIIREAGQRDAVTVSTSMAGRGTDIKLGEGVRELGGLAVIGVGRMANIRQERQARGRSGRQGDPGFSRFYVSLQDETVAGSGLPKIEKYVTGERYAGWRKIRRLVDDARALNEETASIARRQAMNYDQVLQRQRDLIYALRDELLDGEKIDREKILEIARRNIRTFLGRQKGKRIDGNALNRYLLDYISYRADLITDGDAIRNRKEAEEWLMGHVTTELDEQERLLSSGQRMTDFVRLSLLTAIDDGWVEQVDYLQQLQPAVAGRASAQRNPVYEYQKEAKASYERMVDAVLLNAMRNILLSRVYVDEQGRTHITLP